MNIYDILRPKSKEELNKEFQEMNMWVFLANKSISEKNFKGLRIGIFKRLLYFFTSYTLEHILTHIFSYWLGLLIAVVALDLVTPFNIEVIPFSIRIIYFFIIMFILLIFIIKWLIEGKMKRWRKKRAMKILEKRREHLVGQLPWYSM